MLDNDWVNFDRTNLNAFVGKARPGDMDFDIAQAAQTQPEKIKAAPQRTCVCRLDETAAAWNLDIACL